MGTPRPAPVQAVLVALRSCCSHTAPTVDSLLVLEEEKRATVSLLSVYCRRATTNQVLVQSKHIPILRSSTRELL